MNKEMITVEELIFLRQFEDIHYTYIARDADGGLYVFTEEPQRGKDMWFIQLIECEDDIFGIQINSNLFGFISWASKTAWSISDLMKLQVKK